MFADYCDDLDFDSHRRARPRRKNHFLFAALMFVAAYFTTITVHAQQDAIVLNEGNKSAIVGTVKEASDNFIIVTTSGKDMKVVLDDVNLSGPAETVFTPGMTVTVDGEMKGDDFGVPLMSARTVTATSPASGATPTTTAVQ